jgi:hypothetical protein
MSAGTLTNLNDAVASPAMASALFDLAGTYAGGPVAFEGSVDGGQTYPFALAVTPAAGGPAVTALTLAANQAWAGLASTVGFSHVQVRATGGVGGAAAVVVPTMTAAGGAGGGGASGSQVQGNVANAVADSGNPVKVGGKIATSIPGAGVNGNRVDAYFESRGRQGVSLGFGALDVNVINAADGQGNNLGLMAAGGMQFVYNGAWDRQRTPNVFKNLAAVAVTAGTAATAWTPAAGKKFRLMGWMLSLSVAGSVIFKDGGAEFFRTCLMPAGDGKSSPPIANGYLSSLANNVLGVDVSATGAVSGLCFGTEE